VSYNNNLDASYCHFIQSYHNSENSAKSRLCLLKAKQRERAFLVLVFLDQYFRTDGILPSKGAREDGEDVSARGIFVPLSSH
jgi:hypothetical protein